MCHDAILHASLPSHIAQSFIFIPKQAGSNNVRLLSAALVNGFTMLTFQRPLKAHDELDKSILTNGSQPVIWFVQL